MRLLIWVGFSFRFVSFCLVYIWLEKLWRENRTLARCCCNCASNFRATWVLCVFAASQFSRRQRWVCFRYFCCCCCCCWHFAFPIFLLPTGVSLADLAGSALVWSGLVGAAALLIFRFSWIFFFCHAGHNKPVIKFATLSEGSRIGELSREMDLHLKLMRNMEMIDDDRGT